MKNNTKKMVQGAMIAAIFGVLSLLNTYTGSMFDIFICYIMTVPMVWYGYHYGMKNNVILSIVALVVIALVGMPFFIVCSLTSCIIGIFLGEALQRQAKKSTILVVVFIASLLKNILVYQVFAGLFGIDIYMEISQIYKTLVELMPNMANQISIEMLLSMIPIVFIILSVAEMYIIVMLCQIVLKRFQISFPGQFHIAFLHFSKKFGILVIGSLITTYFVRIYINHIIFDYIYMLDILVLGLQGMAFLCWYCILKGQNILVVFVFIGAFIPIVNSIGYVSLGIIDIFSDLRKNILYNSHNE